KLPSPIQRRYCSPKSSTISREINHFIALNHIICCEARKYKLNLRVWTTVSLGNLKTPDTLSSRIAFNYRRDLSMPENSSKSRAAYWHANLKLMLGLLLVWFTISYLCGIV